MTTTSQPPGSPAEPATSTVPNVEVLALCAMACGCPVLDAAPAPIGTRYVTETGTVYEIGELGAIRRSPGEDDVLVEGRPVVVRTVHDRRLIVLGVDTSGRFLRSSAIVAQDPSVTVEHGR